MDMPISQHQNPLIFLIQKFLNEEEMTCFLSFYLVVHKVVY